MEQSLSSETSSNKVGDSPDSILFGGFDRIILNQRSACLLLNFVLVAGNNNKTA
jgi:hypothetical protein